MKLIIALLAIALVLPASAFARPLNDPPPGVDGSRLPAVGTDVAAPDQQSPVSSPSRLEAFGTDVAAPDQQAPRPIVADVPPPASHVEPRFSWADAAAGAAAAAILISVALAGSVLVRRRSSPSAAAG